MTQSAEVIFVSEDNKEAEVCALVTNACLSCSESCRRRGKPFAAVNKKGLPIKKGDLVSIAASKKAEALEALLSLFVPAACAVLACLASNSISLALWKAPASESFKAACVLAGILVPGAAVLALSRFRLRPAKPFIEKIF